MSTQSKKKAPSVKPVEPKPKYSIGGRIFFIIYHRGKPEELVEGKIATRTATIYEVNDGSGKKLGLGINYSYVATTRTVPANLTEEEIYPSFQAAANKFAQAFTTLLK